MKVATINGYMIQGETLEEFKESAGMWHIFDDWLLELVWKYLEKHSSCSVFWNGDNVEFSTP